MREQAQIIRWEDPPPARSTGGRPPGWATSRWGHVAEELRARPAVFAVVAQTTGKGCLDLAWRINRGVMLCFSPPGSFEATTRQDDGVTTVYARYVGDGDA